MNFPELLFFAVLALLVFGPKRLPEIARTVGKAMAELRRASNEFRQSLEEEFHNLEESNPKPDAVDLTPESIEPYRDSTEEDLDQEAAAYNGHGHELPPWEADFEDEPFDEADGGESGWMPEEEEQGQEQESAPAQNAHGIPPDHPSYPAPSEPAPVSTPAAPAAPSASAPAKSETHG